MATTTSPVVWYARILGTMLTIVGIIGLVITTDQNAVEPLFGIDVNLTHNLMFLISGVLGLVVGFSLITSARTYALVLGIVYALLGLWGMLAGGTTFDPLNMFVNINQAGNLLHLAIGVVGIACWTMVRSAEGETVL